MSGTNDRHWLVIPLEPTSLDALIYIEQQCFLSPWSSEMLETYLKKERHLCLGLYTEGALAGFAIFSWLLDEAELLQIGLLDQYRSQGGAEQLLEQGQQILQQHGVSRMLLEVRASNHAAIAFYRRVGFVEDGRRKNYYPTPQGREDAVLMSYGNI